jgi:hypothetical protein
MFDFLLATENLPFTVALSVMFGIAFLEGVTVLMGFALSGMLDTLLPDMDFDIEADLYSELEAPSPFSRLLSWLRVGKVPMLMLLIIFLTGFGLIGLALQSILHSSFDFLLPNWLMSIPAAVLALPVVRVFGGVLNRFMPNDETDAVSIDSLVGRVATITLGTAASGSAAEARVRDVHGTTHYVMVEPDVASDSFPTQSSVLLVRNEGAIFKAITNPNPALVDDDQK